MKFDSRDTIAICSAIIAVVSLGVTIWIGQEARERDFLFKSYERLGHLSTATFKNAENIARWRNQAKKLSSCDEMTKELDIACYMVDTFDEVARARQEIILHQFAMDEDTFTMLNKHVGNISKYYRHWDEARKKSQDTEKYIEKYASALDLFWDEMRKAIDGSLAETARRLRR